MNTARATSATDHRAGGLSFAVNHDVLRRLLIAFVLVFGLRPFVGAGQPAGAPKPPLQLGGLSEKEVLGLLLPGYVEPPLPSQDPNAEPEWDVTRANVTESISSDFGVGTGAFTLVLVNGTRGACSGCGFTVLGVLKPSKQLLVWRLEPEGYWGHELGTLRLAADDDRLSFRFRYDAGLHTHHSYVREAIYRPSVTRSGDVRFDLVWQDLVSSGAGLGSNGVMWHGRCASMTPSSNGGEWVYRRRTFFGAIDRSWTGQLADLSTDPPCEVDDESVEIRREEHWTFQATEGRMVRRSISNRRIDRAPSAAFPFSLPVRSGAWERSGQGSKSAARPVGPVHSADGRFEIQRPTGVRVDAPLLLRSARGESIRELPIFNYDRFPAELEAVGWSEDSSRLFVVAAFEGERALLSFSVEGTDDFWEELLDPYDTSWHDGFVMEPRSKRPN